MIWWPVMFSKIRAQVFRRQVELRLISSQDSPQVKLGTTEEGPDSVLGGVKGHTQLLSRGTDPFIKIVTKDGREQIISL